MKPTRKMSRGDWVIGLLGSLLGLAIGLSAACGKLKLTGRSGYALSEADSATFGYVIASISAVAALACLIGSIRTRDN